MKKIFLFLLFLVLWWFSYSVQAAQNITLSHLTYLSENGVDNTVGLQYYGNVLYIWLNTTYLHSSEVIRSWNVDGRGKIFIFDVWNKRIYRQIVLDSELIDFEVKNDFIYAITRNSTQILTLNGNVLTTKPQAVKMSVDKRGNYALLNSNNELFLYDSNNVLKFQQKLSRTSVEDILLDDISGRVFVVWYDEKTVNGTLLQVAFLQAHDYNGSSRYELFGFEAQNLTQNMAATRLYKLALWADEKVYILWETDGADTIFRYNWKTISGNQSITSIDFFTQLSQINNADIAYFARINPENGNIERSSFSLSRLQNGDANSYKVKDGNISADKSGNVIIAWVNSASFPNRENILVNGQKLDTYNGWDGTLQALNNNFSARYFWTSFGKSGWANTQMKDVVFAWDTIIALGTVLNGEVFTTDTSIRKNTNNINAFLVVFNFDKYSTLPSYGKESVSSNTGSGGMSWGNTNTPNNSSSNSNLSAATQYDEYIKTALANPNIKNAEKLQKYIHPNYYTPKNGKAAKIYIILSGKFNEKKNVLLKSKRTITQADLDVFRNYTVSLYNLMYAIDTKKPTSELKKLLRYFSQDYKNVMNIK